MTLVVSEDGGAVTITESALTQIVVQAAEAVDGARVRRQRHRASRCPPHQASNAVSPRPHRVPYPLRVQPCRPSRRRTSRQIRGTRSTGC